MSAPPRGKILEFPRAINLLSVPLSSPRPAGLSVPISFHPLHNFLLPPGDIPWPKNTPIPARPFYEVEGKKRKEKKSRGARFPGENDARRHTGYYLPRMLTSAAFFCGRARSRAVGERVE